MAVGRSFFVVSTGVRSAFSGASLPTWVAERAEVLCRFAEDRRVFLIVDQTKRRKPCEKNDCLLSCLAQNKRPQPYDQERKKMKTERYVGASSCSIDFLCLVELFFAAPFQRFSTWLGTSDHCLKLDDLKLAESLKTLWEIVVTTVFKAFGTTTRLRFRKKAWTLKCFFSLAFVSRGGNFNVVSQSFFPLFIADEAKIVQEELSEGTFLPCNVQRPWRSLGRVHQVRVCGGAHCHCQPSLWRGPLLCGNC